MRSNLVLAIYLVIGVVDLVMGTIYFTSSQFLAYHSQAIGTPWQDLDTGVQAVILAVMRVAGGGWLALGFFTIALAVGVRISSNTLARWLLPAGTIVFYVPSFVATWAVYRETGAQSPWGPSLAMIVIALAALMIDGPWSSRTQGKR